MATMLTTGRAAFGMVDGRVAMIRGRSVCAAKGLVSPQRCQPGSIGGGFPSEIGLTDFVWGVAKSNLLGVCHQPHPCTSHRDGADRRFFHLRHQHDLLYPSSKAGSSRGRKIMVVPQLLVPLAGLVRRISIPPSSLVMVQQNIATYIAKHQDLGD
jgi:hypothetical protein